MAWTAPMTFVSGNVLTAAQLNTHLRDNLLETAPAKATAAGSFITTTGANSIAARLPVIVTTSGSSSTSSTTYTTLADGGGPTTFVAGGTKCIVMLSALVQNNTDNQKGYMSFTITATAIAADDSRALIMIASGAQSSRATMSHLISGLTPGTQEYLCLYRASANTATFADRTLIVIPF